MRHTTSGGALRRIGAQEIERYLAARRTRPHAIVPTDPLVWSGPDRRSPCPYTREGFAQGFRALFRTVGIRMPAGQPPRVQDTRYSCAVQALLRRYRAGSAVQAKLPLLATSRGHVSIVSTAYYLHVLTPARTLASPPLSLRRGNPPHQRDWCSPRVLRRGSSERQSSHDGTRLGVGVPLGIDRDGAGMFAGSNGGERLSYTTRTKLDSVRARSRPSGRHSIGDDLRSEDARSGDITRAPDSIAHLDSTAPLTEQARAE